MEPNVSELSLFMPRGQQTDNVSDIVTHLDGHVAEPVGEVALAVGGFFVSAEGPDLISYQKSSDFDKIIGTCMVTVGILDIEHGQVISGEVVLLDVELAQLGHI